MTDQILDLTKLEEHHVLNMVLIEQEASGMSRKQLADIAEVPYKTFCFALSGRGSIGFRGWGNIVKKTGTKIPKRWLEVRGYALLLSLATLVSNLPQ